MAPAHARPLLPVATTVGADDTTAPDCGPDGCASGGCGAAVVGDLPPAGDGVRTLVDEFLAEQATTSAVERFSHAHDGPVPAQARWYRDLLPATAPGPGQQYAFAVDLDSCSGCKACVAACHSLNGLDEGESWRSVGLLVGDGDRAMQQTVPTGCHHCTDPGCLRGCPVDAYVKDDDGIVVHLDDQCIGCSYCTLTCPYEVPDFDHDRGIVRKCDMCHDRLAVGEAPACVQACPTNAISITVVDVAEAGREGFGFASPEPAATTPTTVFTSSRDLETDVVPADRATVQPRRAHTPLAVMLVLTQLAVGTFTGVEALRLLGFGAGSALGAVVALGVTVVALVASLAHLGRPQYAWRAVLGLRHSWLSREIVSFGLFAPLGVLHAAAVWQPPGVTLPPPSLTGPPAVLAGLAAVGASVMVYVATRREGWGARHVGGRFALTTVVLGVVATGLLGLATGAVPTGTTAWVLRTGAALAGLAVVVDLLPRRHADGDGASTRTRTALLLRGPLVGAVRLRTASGIATVALLTVAAATAVADALAPAIAFAVMGTVAATLGEGVARWWFFTAEGSPRMPGVPA